MWKAALAGAVLATMTVGVSVAQTYETASASAQTAASTPAVTPGKIARLKSALKLTPDQAKYWPAVESALRSLAQRQARADGEPGWRQRATAVAMDANALRRVASAAAALISRLDETQKQNGVRMVRAMGFGSLVAAY
jgi:hypothetical protein